jgi:hypothetical protein
MLAVLPMEVKLCDSAYKIYQPPTPEAGKSKKILPKKGAE